MKLISLFLLITVTISIHSQQFSNWRNYTAMNFINDIAETNEGLWAATTGGAFFYNFNDESFKEYRKADGLNSINITAVIVDNRGRIWFGGSDGVIDVYNPADNSFRTLLDIYNNDQRSQKRINNFEITGDTVIASTDFGVSLIDAESLIFIETFSKFGTLPSFIKANYSLKKDLFYVALVSGLAVQKPGSTNLSSPDSWNIFQTSNGLQGDSISKILFWGESLIAATKGGLSKFNGTAWESFIPELTGRPIADIFATGEALYILSQNIIYKYEAETLSVIHQATFLTKIFNSNFLGLCAASNEGIFIFNNNSPDFIFPNGPAANLFPSITVDNNGNFWSASGRNNLGRGFYKYDGIKWTNYSLPNFPLPTNDYQFAVSTPDNAVYIGSWGRGFVSIKDDQLRVFTTENTDLVGIQGSTDFLVISGFGIDSKNNLWILNYWAANRETLSMLTPDSSWFHFMVPSQISPQEGQYNLIIDFNDTKWFNNNNENSRRGLYYFNEMKTYNDPSDDRSGFLTEVNGLNNNTISSIIIDNRGDIWVGTTSGVNIISNTNTIVSQSSPNLNIRSVFSLRQQSVNCMAVDPLNQKWIGTNQGVHLVNSDGTAILATFNISNSALLSDEIKSITVDKNNGLVYVGTDAGLTSFLTPAIMPKETLSELTFYPNPFVTNRTSQLTIEGLIRDSEIKILDINGNLVTEFATPGGRRAFWDGTDINGETVSTGIYFIVAFDANGDNVATGKIAVFRD